MPKETHYRPEVRLRPPCGRVAASIVECDSWDVAPYVEVSHLLPSEECLHCLIVQFLEGVDSSPEVVLSWDVRELSELLIRRASKSLASSCETQLTDAAS